jgi:hypothetical protein
MTTYRNQFGLLRMFLAVLAFTASLFSGGCITQGFGDMYNPSAAMVATPQLPFVNAIPGGLAVTITGIDVYPELGFKNGRGFNREFKDALSISIEKARLFSAQAGNPVRYQLVAEIVDCTLPDSGFTMTATASAEVTYSLTDTRDGKVVWQKTISTSDTRTASDSITGAYRLFIALDGAFHKSIEAALIDIAGLHLS